MRHEGMVFSAEFGVDGQRVLTASLDGSTQVWDAATGKAISEPTKQDDEIASVEFSADGQRVLTASKKSDGASLGYADDRKPR
jgi:WD40 repeat protein